MSVFEKKEAEKDEKIKKKKSKKSFFKEFIIDIGIACIAAILIWRFVGYGVWIKSGSMEPALQIKDKLIVSRVYNYNNLNYGDIVLFKNEEYGDDILIKRLIGRPGDKIEIKNGVVFRNGEKLQEDYVENNEIYNGVFEVPEENFFFLGDNRAHSADARYWDNPYVDESQIEGKAILRYYPFNQFKLLN